MIYIYTVSHNNVPFYVGATKNLKHRASCHKSNKKRNLYNKIALLGFNNIDFDIVDSCKDSDQEIIETYWIDQFRSWGFTLDNKVPGGNAFKWVHKIPGHQSKASKSRVNTKHTDTTKEKIRLSRIGKVGEKAGNTKLTEHQAKIIKYSNDRNKDLADQFGVTAAAISNIKRCVAWRHI